MKLFQLVLAVLLIGFFGCQHSTNEIIIVGKITGKFPEKVEYTSPINGICNWGFTESVRPDSIGNFKIKIESDKTIFIKLRTAYSEQGTLIIEPGKTYTVAFDLNRKDTFFSVTDSSSIIQDAYNKFPNPPHIQVGAMEFQRDSVISRIKSTVEQRRSAEIAVFEKFRSDKVISQDIFDLVKTDRNCYYDAVLATTAWVKDYMFIQRGLKVFTPEVENLWRETFKNPLFSNPKIVNSAWFNFYAESYIYFKEYTNGNFTKEKLEEIAKSNQPKSYRVKRAKEYLPKELCENYLAYYLNDESSQKKYEKELISLFDDFKSQYPGSRYNSFISPLIDEVIKFQNIAESKFGDKMKFVKNYQNLNSMADLTNAMDKGRIFVDVWATWCGPCRASIPHLTELAHKFTSVTFIGMDVWENGSDQEATVAKFVKNMGEKMDYHVAMDTADTFMADLAARLIKRVQLSSDALGAYPDAVERGFGANADYGQIVKTYSVSHLGNFKEAARRYSPAEVVLVEKHIMAGTPDICRITTSHVEKQNHTLRMHCRRLTRLTNAFSKKLDNFKAAVSLHMAYYNFCKMHLAIRCTPAMAAGIEPSQWTVADLVKNCGE